jgi:hypothetical protein
MGARETVPPSARESIWPPRQCPITGTPSVTAQRMSWSTGCVHGYSSLALMGPPMKPRPE